MCRNLLKALLFVVAFAWTAKAEAQVFISNDMNGGTAAADVSTYNPLVGGNWSLVSGYGNDVFGTASPNDMYGVFAASTGQNTNLIVYAPNVVPVGSNIQVDEDVYLYSTSTNYAGVILGNRASGIYYRIGITESAATTYLGINKTQAGNGDQSLTTYAGDNTSLHPSVGLHHIRVIYTAATGQIALYWDNSSTALTTAVDQTISVNYVGAGLNPITTVSSSTGLHIKNFVAQYVATPAATSYTVSSPTTGAVNVASTPYVVTPNGASTATVTPASTVAGSFSPSTVTFDGLGTPVQFTFTPTATGTATVSLTNSGSLPNPANSTYVSATAGSAPSAPTFSVGSRYQAFPITVSITSPSGGSIYYTLDGSTPTSAKSKYTASLSITSQVTLKAVAILNGVASPVTSAIYHDARIYPGKTWYDTTGTPIYSTDGIVYNFAGTYYWYGTDRNAATAGGNQVSRPVAEYSSTDLLNWTFVADVLQPDAFHIEERPHVMYNATTSKYVMWVHYENTTYTLNQNLIATSTTPTGPWTIQSYIQPDGNPSFDFGLFQDTDGTGYTAYNSQLSGVSRTLITKLSSDYLSVIAGSTIDTGLGSREADSMFKRGSTYFLVTSGLNGWYPALNTYATASSPLGTWTNQGNAFQPNLATDNTIAFNSQASSVLQVNGNFMYLGTANAPATDLIQGTQVWEPIQFPTAGSMAVNYLNEWSPSSVFTLPGAGRSYTYQ